MKTTRSILAWLVTASVPIACGTAHALDAPPTWETRRVADGVYAFRYGGYQSLFIVGKDGVIATDPSARNKPGAVPKFLAEIRKVTALRS